MKLTEAPTKIVGIQLGEAKLNFIRVGEAPIVAKFALITKEGDAAGFVDMMTGWSDKALEALRVFSEVLEEEALARIFTMAQASETPQTEEHSEPPQF